VNNSGNVIYHFGDGNVMTDSSIHHHVHTNEEVDPGKKEKERVCQRDLPSELSQLTPLVAQQGDVANHGRYELVPCP